MRSAAPDHTLARRVSRLLLAASATTAGLVLLLMIPDLWGLLPWPIRRHPVETSIATLLASYLALRVRSQDWPKEDGRDRLVFQVRSIVEHVAAWALPRGLTAGAAVLGAGLLLCWIPHYLTWPWCRDEDTFATLALSWDLGVVPYRDIRAYNFPGHIYLHWILGKTFGWGKTVPFYALDSVALVSLGMALAVWSRRLLGAALPGLVSYLAFLTFYLGLEYETVAERDWHATWLVALGRGGRLAAAVNAGIALVIRPHAMLFLPAIASAVAEGAIRSQGPPISIARALREWIIALLVILVLAFSPLWLAGVLDNLIQGLRVASYGGPYSRATPASILAAFGNQLQRERTAVVLALSLLTWRLGPFAWRRASRTWLLALLGALVYRPLHPVQHAYLAHPLELLQAIALALPVAWLVESPILAKPVRLLAVVLVLYEVLPEIPRFCRPHESLRALKPLLRGEEPPIPPLGSIRYFHRRIPCEDNYCWSDYRKTLEYLRRTTTPKTPVANILRTAPFPSLNGPTGRPSPFRTESGICWMWLIDEDLDAEYAEAIERDPNTVVVWSPDETAPRLTLEKLTSVVRRHYHPEARFGAIEVWRRRNPRLNNRSGNESRTDRSSG